MYVYSRDRSFPKWPAAPCLPGLQRHRHLFLPALRRQNRDDQFAHRTVAEHGFCSQGGGQPVGFSIGLVVGGVLAGTVGWRWGYYILAILNAIVFVVAIYGQPKSRRDGPITWQRIAYEIDWVGVIIPSTALAMLSYVLA